MRKYTFLLLCLFLGSCYQAAAQKFLWDITFDGFFDNREFKAPYQRPQTFFGTRLSPELGLQIKGEHQLIGGLSWIQEFGATDTGNVDWRIYYRYNGAKFKASFGSFSRKLLAEEYPVAMISDSMRYFDPNINGALFQYFLPSGHIEAYIDWQSRQTQTQREVFTIASSGRFQKNWFGGGWFFWMNHFAKSKQGVGENLIDNMLVNPYVFFDMSAYVPLNVLSLKTGSLISLDRNRGQDEWITPVGFLGELKAEWRFLGVHETFYAGGNQLPFYDDFGSMLHYSDPFYRAPVYSRTDIYAYLLRNKYVTCKASFNLHTAGGRLQTQQMLNVCFHLDQDDIRTKNWKKFFSR